MACRIRPSRMLLHHQLRGSGQGNNGSLGFLTIIFAQYLPFHTKNGIDDLLLLSGHSGMSCSTASAVDC
jgi:hypothetical protein